MASKYTTELYAEPERIEVPAQATPVFEGKENNRFSIDFETLERVLARDDGEEDHVEAEPKPYNELRRQDSYRFPTASANYAKSQRIILYSPSFDLTFQATSFQDLGIYGMDLPRIFSEDADHLWWMDVQNPSEKELRLLCSAFKIHPLTIEDILNREIQEKIEDFTHYYFACFRSYHVEDTTTDKIYQPYTIYMVVFPAGTLSFCFSDSEHADHVLTRIELLKDYLSINSDWIFYAFVYVLLRVAIE
jgi:Mg2+ and Co2+ transporter CorA